MSSERDIELNEITAARARSNAASFDRQAVIYRELADELNKSAGTLRTAADRIDALTDELKAFDRG